MRIARHVAEAVTSVTDTRHDDVLQALRSIPEGAGVAFGKETLVKHFSLMIAATVLGTIAIAPAQAQPARGASAYDGPWHLTFTTQKGTCDSSYDFNVNISNGVISHPNLVRFQGSVGRSGAVSASVAVQDKTASGRGRLTLSSGSGNWSGYSGSARCSGHWSAHRI